MYLVSVGTTKFDGLIEAADALSIPGGLFQIAAGDYIPKNHEYFRFTDNLGELMDKADFIISHAGVGVLFESLKRGKKVICVPNLERSDKHQIEIAEELEKRGLILLVTRPEDLGGASKNVSEFRPKPFDIPRFRTQDFCKIAGIHDGQVVAILASGGGHLEEARILAGYLVSENTNLSIDFYIPFETRIKNDDFRDSRTVHFRPYTAKYRGILGWGKFFLSTFLTFYSSLAAKIPRRPDHVISVGTADTAILFARLGWMGANRIILESRARVGSVSYTLRVLRLFRSQIFKQWETSKADVPSVGVLYE